MSGGTTRLQSCQHALQLGGFAGKNSARDLIGLPTIPYVQPPYVTCLDLGRSGAVFTRGWQRTVELTGAEAKAVKRRISSIEASVKDEGRFAEKWAYFDFGPTETEAVPFPKEARCFSCHKQNGAVDNTFVQFYPTLQAR